MDRVSLQRGDSAAATAFCLGTDGNGKTIPGSGPIWILSTSTSVHQKLGSASLEQSKHTKEWLGGGRVWQIR